MRLTLRTLLAYRDGVLSSAETSDLHRRIKQTAVAANLLKRIENVVQRPNIVPPKLIGSGLAGDPNSAAAYLDDTLPAQQVPELERICIAESEAHLAELAHCHQLLAGSLTGNVDVPHELRQRVCALGKANQRVATSTKEQNLPATNSPVGDGRIVRQDQAHVDHAMQQRVQHVVATPVQAPMVSSGGGSIKPQGLDLEGPQLAQEVPEYLAGARRDGWRIPLAIGGLLALLAVLVWQSIGSLEKVQELLNSSAIAAKPTGGAPSDANNSLPQTRASNSEQQLPNSSTSARRPPDSPPAKNEPPNTGAATTQRPDQATAQPDAAPVPSIPDQPSPERPPEEKPALDKTPIDNSTRQQLPPNSAEQEIFTWSPRNESERSAVIMTRVAQVAEITQVVESTEVAKSLRGSGTAAMRLQPGQSIPLDHEIVIPPSMRTAFDGCGRAVWTACGPSKLSVKSLNPLTVKTSLCRALVQGGPHGNQIAIETSAGNCVLQFADATSMAAVELSYRPAANGIVGDPRSFLPVLAVVAVEGQVTVSRPNIEDFKSSKLEIGQGWASVDGQSRNFQLAEIPAWYRSSINRPLDEKAAADFHTLMLDVADVEQSLIAACSFRRPETAALAIQTRMMLGDWSIFASNFLGDESMRSHWIPCLVIAEQLIASEKSMEPLMSAWQAVYPMRVRTLGGLMLGSSEDLSASQFLANLVTLLDSSQLDERVLAAHQLRRLTGRDGGYQPSLPNRSVIQQWRRELNSGKLTIPNAGDPLWEARP